MKSLRNLVIAVAALFLTVICGCTDPAEILRFDPVSQEPVKIGVILPLTGKDAAQGKKMLNGARFAADELNSRRGHFGRQVDLVVVDTNSTGAGAAKAFGTAVDAGVSGIVGGYSTMETQAITPLAQVHRVPLVIPMATGNDDVIGSNKFVFRAVFTDKQQSEMIAGYMKYYRRVGRIVIAVSKNPADIYSRNVARDVAESFRSLGGEVVCVCEVDENAPQAAMRDAVSFSPDAVVLPFGSLLAAKCYKELRELGYLGLICGPDSWDDPLFFKELRGIKTLGNCFYTAFFTDEARHSEYKAFRDTFRKKRYYYPDSCEIQTFDAVNMLLIGFGNNADNLKRFKKNWQGMRKHAGAAALYTMESGNKIDRTIYINRVGQSADKSGRLVPKNITGLQYSRLKDYKMDDDDE